MKKSSIKTDPKEVVRRIKDAVIMLELNNPHGIEIEFNPKKYPVELFKVDVGHSWYATINWFEDKFKVCAKGQVLISNNTRVYCEVIKFSNVTCNVLNKLHAYYKANFKPVKKRKSNARNKI